MERKDTKKLESGHQGDQDKTKVLILNAIVDYAREVSSSGTTREELVNISRINPQHLDGAVHDAL